MNEVFVTRSSMPIYEDYVKAIKPLWDNRWLTNMGRYHRQFEQELKTFLQVKHVSLMVNGHMALEMALQSFGFPKWAEVITTPFTFISTTHAIVRNDLKPVFCDVKESDGTIDESKIEDIITEKTVAIMPVHVYGNVCNTEEIQRIADKYNLKVIYDAAHAFGETYKKQGIGSFGDASIFSFHATKIFNTIEGGAVTFSDSRIHDKLYNLKNFGIRGEELVVEVGANAKMNEFCAIMGLCNLKRVEETINVRKECHERYMEFLAGVKGIRFFDWNPDATRNYGYFPIIIEKDYPMSRDMLYDKLKDNGIYTRKYFYPLTSDQACFKNKYRNNRLDVARRLAERVLVLPLYEGLGKEQIARISDIVYKK